MTLKYGPELRCACGIIWESCGGSCATPCFPPWRIVRSGRSCWPWRVLGFSSAATRQIWTQRRNGFEEAGPDISLFLESKVPRCVTA